MDAASQHNALRRLERRLLPVGEPLPGCLHDDDGRVLVQTGVTLDEDQLDTLFRVARRGVFVGSDWPKAESSPDEKAELSSTIKTVLAAAGGGKGNEARQHERHDYGASVAVELRGPGGGERRMTVATLDISSSGFAFETDGFIHSGVEVIAAFEHLPNQPRILGVVRNCIHVEGRRHRVGVEFVRVVR